MKVDVNCRRAGQCTVSGAGSARTRSTLNRWLWHLLNYYLSLAGAEGLSEHRRTLTKSNIQWCWNMKKFRKIIQHTRWSICSERQTPHQTSVALTGSSRPQLRDGPKPEGSCLLVSSVDKLRKVAWCASLLIVLVHRFPSNIYHINTMGKD